MLVEQRPDTILQELIATGVEFVVVGGSAAVIQGANYVTDDLDIGTLHIQHGARLCAHRLAEGIVLVDEIDLLDAGSTFQEGRQRLHLDV